MTIRYAHLPPSHLAEAVTAINLYRLNQTSLDQLKESVTATKETAQVMADQFGL